MSAVHSRPVPDQPPAVVATLHDLIQMLYPDPNPDVFTLDAFQFRYKLRNEQEGLSEKAIRDIEQSRRISRRISNYQQAGLCEFHIGLIYLHEWDYRGAREQFEQAQQQWTFVYDPAAVGLALFAQGVAQQLAFHFEDAMACYTKANQWLPRIRFAPPAHYPEQFLDRLAAAVQTHQEQVRETLWQGPEDTAVVTDASTGAETEAETAVVDEPPTLPTEESTPAEESTTEAPAEATAAPPTPMPIIHMGSADAAEIIPGHRRIESQFEWYLIERQPPVDFFPADVQQGGWLLVEKAPPASSGELVLVKKVGNGSGQQERVLVRSMSSQPPHSRIYLAWLDEPDGVFSRNTDTGVVTFAPSQSRVPVNVKEILGVVVGFWLPVQIK